MSEKDLIEKDLFELQNKQQEEQIKNLERYHFLKENGFILFEVITGSQAHGTNTESSDIDKAFVYILPQDDILGNKYKEQLKIHKDFMGYEIKRFLELLKKGNPTILELLNSPKDCLILKHPAFDILLKEKDKFVTKVCESAFYGYAKQQRQKAEGLEKLQNWEAQRVVKKNPIDFCYAIVGYDAIPVRKWLDEKGLDQLFCALTAVTHCRDLFAVFYDYEAHNVFSERIPKDQRDELKAKKIAAGETLGLGYKGIAFEDSNDIRLSNIPIEERRNSIGHISYNKDGYRKHCDDFKKYQTWLEERNEKRWVEIKGHGQQIDGKNMMHFMRLVLIGKEIAEGKGINIRRPDAQELLKIRRGEISLLELFEKSDSILAEMKMLFQNSNLPDEVSDEFIHEKLVEIRNYFYKKNRGFVESAEFNKSQINNEDNNIFIKKRFGEYSELQFELKHAIDECIKIKYQDRVDEFLSSKTDSWFKSLIALNNWPKTVNLLTGKLERVSTEKFSIVNFTRDKLSIMAQGDLQIPIVFDIVMWGDSVAVINVKQISEFKGNELSFELFFKFLGYIK